MMDGAILLRDSRGEKADTSIAGTVINFLSRKSSSVVVVRGELLVPIPENEVTPRSDGQKPHNYHLKRDPTVSLYCKEDDIAPLGEYEFLLLEGIKSHIARYEVFISASNQLDWGLKLKPGDEVCVCLPTQHAAPVHYAAAVIRYVGALKTEPGIQFGVEITEKRFRGCGSTNGYFQGEQIFLCDEGCGMFVGLDKLSPDHQSSSHAKGSSSSTMNESSARKSPRSDQRHPDGSSPPDMMTRFRERASNSVQRQACGTSIDTPRSMFSTGDRVVVYTRHNVRVPGVVKWVGKVTGDGVDFIAVGIETDCLVKKEDFADALQNMTLFKVLNPRHGKVFLPEAFVAPEEVDAQQRAQEQRSKSHTHNSAKAALAEEFGISPREIAEQQQAFMYVEQAKVKKDVEKYRDKREVKEVQKTTTENTSVDEQRRRWKELQQEKKKLTMPPQNTERNAATSVNVNVPATYPSTQLLRHGPGLPHQHSQPPPQSFQTGSRLGPPHQFSLDAPHPSPVHQASHEYEAVPGMQMQRQGTSDEEHWYGHIGTRGYRGTQPEYRASLHPAPPQSAPPQPNPQPVPSQELDPPHHDHFSADPVRAQVPLAYVPPPQQGVQLGELGVGSAVQVSDPPRYGVIRWIGELPNIMGIMAGVELDEYMEGCGDGTWREIRYFTCPYGRGFFCPYNSLSPDRRFHTSGNTPGAASAVNYAPPTKSSLSKQKIPEEKIHERQDLQERYKHLEEQLRQEKQQHTQLEQQLRQERQETAQLRQETARLRQEMAQERQEAAQVKQQLERQLQELIAENQRLQQQVADTQTEAQRTRLIQPQSTLEAIEYWKVPRREIQIIREVGVGAWGSVSEGKYKDQLVAVKQPHRAILTSHIVKRLQREVQIMAQVCHPNLVRFIAAVFDDKVQRLEEPPMIVLELLDMNLRTAYERDVLGASKIPIFRDVAYALHYLHEHQDPIIHRDISTPNVLLEALPQGAWKAKVSDFGSANLEKRSKTAGEGAIIYSAPETFPHTDPTTLPPPHTTKIDVFSYGILLCEVITKQLPEDSTIYRRMLQLVQSQWLFMYDLIVSCTKRDPNERPTMAQVLDKLNKLPRPRPRVRQHS